MDTIDNTGMMALTILAMVALICIYVFTGISVVRNNPLFRNSVGEVSRRYETDITPANYAFGIWNLIFLWEAAWVLFAVSSIWRTTAEGPILMNPDVLPMEFYIFWILSCVFYVGWLFLWDREYLLIAFIDLLLLTLSGYAAVAFQGIATAKYADELSKKSDVDLTLIYVLVQNGTDLFYSWTTIATLLNLSSALTYDPMVKKRVNKITSGTIALAVLGVLVIGWSVCENTVFYEYFKYVYAWYGVLLWACSGILVKNFDKTSRNSIITVILLCVIIVCLVAKIAVYTVSTFG
uniref:uncharacterized protein LOC120331753 n=1 Tax=Styela clava TaxID=7725 RepID=UPI00193A3CB2|nr:uncharacterized protein LOC120331753 [Styela clava]